MGTDHGAGVWRGPRVEAARRDARRRVQAGRDQDQGARRARRLCRLSAENYGASEWRAASRAADVTQRVTGLRVAF